jgi:hypothetical protein
MKKYIILTFLLFASVAIGQQTPMAKKDLSNVANADFANKASAAGVGGGTVDNAAVNAAIVEDRWASRDATRNTSPIIGHAGFRTYQRTGITDPTLRIMAMGDSFSDNNWEKSVAPLGPIMGWGGGGFSENNGDIVRAGTLFDQTTDPVAPTGTYVWSRSINGQYWGLQAGATATIGRGGNRAQISRVHVFYIKEGVSAGPNFSIKHDSATAGTYVDADASVANIPTHNGTTTPELAVASWNFTTPADRRVQVYCNTGPVRIMAICVSAIPSGSTQTWGKGVEIYHFGSNSLNIASAATVPQQFFDVLWGTLNPHFVSWKSDDGAADFVSGLETYYTKARKAATFTTTDAHYSGGTNKFTIKTLGPVIALHLYASTSPTPTSTTTELVSGTTGFIRVSVGSPGSNLRGDITVQQLVDLLNTNYSAILTAAVAPGSSGANNITSGSTSVSFVPQLPIEANQPDWVFLGNHPRSATNSRDLSAADKELVDFALETSNCFVNTRAIIPSFDLIAALPWTGDGLHADRTEYVALNAFVAAYIANFQPVRTAALPVVSEAIRQTLAGVPSGTQPIAEVYQRKNTTGTNTRIKASWLDASTNYYETFNSNGFAQFFSDGGSRMYWGAAGNQLSGHTFPWNGTTFNFVNMGNGYVCMSLQGTANGIDLLQGTKNATNSSNGTVVFRFDKLGNLKIDEVGSTVFVKSGANGMAGTVVANGTTAVAVSTTAFDANSSVILTLKTSGGSGPTLQPYVSAVTPGTGFSIKSAAGDTSTYNWMVLKSH